MGAEREDTDPKPQRGGTEPGLGADTRPGGGAPPAEDVEPAAVDFDALHAALGDPLDYEEMASGPALEKGSAGDTDELLDGLEAALVKGAAGRARPGGESSGRSSATYASSRPRTIPPTRPSNEDPNAPAVIVAAEDTVPRAPPQMTVRLAPVPPHVGPSFGPGPHAQPPPMGMGGPPSSRPSLPQAHAHNASGPMTGHPGSGPHAQAAPSYGQTPVPFPAPGRGVPQMTVRMPDRPINPRRSRTATVVVRPRGPSAKQKLIAFMAMLLLVTACGIAVIVWRKPHWLGLDAAVDPSAAAVAPPSTTPAPPATTPAPPPTTPAPPATTPAPPATTPAPAPAPVKKAPKVAPAPRPSALR
jgi:hypothetical protein